MNSNIKNVILKKAKILLIIFVTLFSSMNSNTIESRASITVTSGRAIENTGAKIYQNGWWSFWNDGINYLYVNGEIAFCVEPMVIGVDGHSYTSGDFDSATRHKLSLIAYYGWDKSAKTDIDYATTQYMIWEALGATFEWRGSFGSQYPTLKAKVQAQINSHNTKPSFNGTTQTIKENETLTLTDANGVLSGMYLVNDYNGQIKINGNNLVITPNGSDNSLTIQARKIPEKYTGSSIAYRSGSGQDVGTFKVTDPLFANIRVNIEKINPIYEELTATTKANEKVNVSLTKTDIDNGLALSEAEFDFYRDDVLFASGIKSNINGIASATFTKEYTATSSSKRYVTNWNELSSANQQAVINSGAFKSRDEAYINALKEAQAKANELASQRHTYKAIETKSKKAYYLDPTNSEVTTTITGSGNINLGMTNKRITGIATIIKHDSETGENAQGEASLNGAVYGLYAHDDILNPANGNIEYYAGEEVNRVSVNGLTTITDLYLGKYYWQEITPPTGYQLNTEKYFIELSQNGNNPTVEINTVATDEVIKGSIEIIKKLDDTNNSVGNNFTFDITNKDGKVVDTVTTDEIGYTKTKELPYGIYTVSERASDGFELLKPFEVIINENNKTYSYEITNIAEKGKFGFYKKGEQFTHILPTLNEFGELSSPEFTEQYLAGAEIEIYANEDIYVGENLYYSKDELVDTLTSDLDIVYSKDLPVGEYYYIETKSPLGYVPNNDKHIIEIEVNEISEDTLINNLPTYNINFTKKLEKNSALNNAEAYKDVVFGLYAREDIYNYRGDVTIGYDSLIDTLYVDENGDLINPPTLPVGTYYLQELATNEAYILDTNQYDFSIEHSNKETVEININNGEEIINELKEFNFQVNKVDSVTKDPIISKDFEFTAYLDENLEQPLMSVNADQETGTANFTLNYGTYYIKETKAPSGYNLSNEVIKVEINDVGVFINDELQSKNDIYSFEYANELKEFNLQVNKVDSVTKKPVISKDFEFTAYLDDSLQQKLISVNANQESGTANFTLNYGTYYIKETNAPTGYLLSNEVIKVEINDDGVFINDKLQSQNDIYSFVYFNSPLIDDKIPPTGDNSNIWGYLFLSLISLFGFSYLSSKRNK